MTSPTSVINPKTGVAFHRVTRAQPLAEYLIGVAAEHLLDQGAVYVDGRRAVVDQSLAIDQVLRIHTKPKRYPVPSTPLRQRIVFDHADFVVLDKPSGLPTHATLDNARENAASLLSAELGQPLLVTHRLDIPTDGLLILARNREAQRAINREFERGRVAKRYEARALIAIPPGEYRHFIDPAAHVPRPIGVEPRDGWWDCRLVVAGSRRIGRVFAHEVRPLTGKTHQIRAQFAALGAPLVNDDLYGGPAGDRFGLTCVGMRLRIAGVTYDLARS